MSHSTTGGAAPQVGQDYRWWGLWACHSTTGGAGLQVVRSVGLSQHNRWGRTTGGGGVCGPLTAPQVGQVVRSVGHGTTGGAAPQVGQDYRWSRTTGGAGLQVGQDYRWWGLWVGLAVRGGNTECTDTGCLGTVYRYGSKCTGIPEPTQGAELSLSLCLSLSQARTCIHVHTHTHTRARAHARTHTHYAHTCPLPPTPPARTYLFPSFYLHITSSSYLPSISVYQSCQYALGSATRNPLNLA